MIIKESYYLWLGRYLSFIASESMKMKTTDLTQTDTYQTVGLVGNCSYISFLRIAVWIQKRLKYYEMKTAPGLSLSFSLKKLKGLL